MLIKDALRVGRGDVIALTGGGGKTTVMFRLATELTDANMTVVTTMTTKIFVGQMARAPASILLEEEAGLFDALPRALAQHRHVLVGGRIGADREKLEGVPPEIVDRIARAQLADAVIVEADGSRRRPFKAPSEREPVVPETTTVLVPLVGLDALGQPLDAEHTHRPELIAALTGAASGDAITPEMVATVLTHSDGGAKGLPPAARLVPLLNKADLPGADETARRIARLLLDAPLIDSILLTAAETGESACEAWGRVAVIILAGGQGSRFGGLKQVLPWRGRPLVAHVAAQALACPDVNSVVVTAGAEADQVRQAVGALVEQGQVVLADAPDWAEGQSRSAAQGLAAAIEASPGPLSAVIFLLADQPGVSPELLAALIRRHRETAAFAVAPRYGGQRGNPVLFDRRAFGQFERLTGDTGGRAILRGREDEIAWVDWPSDEILRDIDTPEDYAAQARD